MSKVIIYTPRKFADDRGWFVETYNAGRELGHGIRDTFVQDNQSYSIKRGTIRGIHFQTPPQAQSKLVRCTRGAVLDYVVDIRRGSPTYGQHISAELSASNGSQLYVPIGFGHAFVTLEPGTEICYKVSAFYSAEADAGIRWDCPDIGIEWPVAAGEIELSAKDRALPTMRDFETPFRYDGVPLELVVVSTH